MKVLGLLKTNVRQAAVYLTFSLYTGERVFLKANFDENKREEDIEGNVILCYLHYCKYR
jgi:hypothetical protein